MNTRRVVGVWVALLLAAPGCFAGTWNEPQGIPHDNLTRWFRHFVPNSVPAEGHPVVMVLHGGGGNMNQVIEWSTFTEWQTIADEEGILLLAPNGVNAGNGDTQGANQRWNDCRGDQVSQRSDADDVGFFNALLDWAEQNFTIDVNRVYVTGESNGGFMSYRAAAEMGDRVAAVAASISNQPVYPDCSGYSHPVSVLICNGDDDDYIPWEGGCPANDPDCGRGRTYSAFQTRDFWIDLLNANPTPSETIDHTNVAFLDGSTVQSERYTGGVDGTEVWFYRVFQGGHNSPSNAHALDGITRALLGLGNQNRDIEGARQAWTFFQRHTLFDASARTDPGAVGGLRLGKGAGGALQLSWSPDCGIGTQYGIYRGDLSLGYGSLDLVNGTCTHADTSLELQPGAPNAEFFLVVPNDGTREGSYGQVGELTPRIPATSACLPQASVDACSTLGL